MRGVTQYEVAVYTHTHTHTHTRANVCIMRDAVHDLVPTACIF